MIRTASSDCVPIHHTCDISRFRRELPIWSLSSRSHARETKPPDERFFQCHFSRTVFQSEHFIVYGSIYLANKLFTAQKCLPGSIYLANKLFTAQKCLTVINMTIDACQIALTLLKHLWTVKQTGYVSIVTLLSRFGSIIFCQ